MTRSITSFWRRKLHSVTRSSPRARLVLHTARMSQTNRDTRLIHWIQLSIVACVRKTDMLIFWPCSSRPPTRQTSILGFWMIYSFIPRSHISYHLSAFTSNLVRHSHSCPAFAFLCVGSNVTARRSMQWIGTCLDTSEPRARNGSSYPPFWPRNPMRPIREKILFMVRAFGLSWRPIHVMLVFVRKIKFTTSLPRTTKYQVFLWVTNLSEQKERMLFSQNATRHHFLQFLTIHFRYRIMPFTRRSGAISIEWSRISRNVETIWYIIFWFISWYVFAIPPPCCCHETATKRMYRSRIELFSPIVLVRSNIVQE